jgi:hypothetical protein
VIFDSAFFLVEKGWKLCCKLVSMARVNWHPHWYLYLFERGLVVAILSPKNVLVTMIIGIDLCEVGK